MRFLKFDIYGGGHVGFFNNLMSLELILLLNVPPHAVDVRVPHHRRSADHLLATDGGQLKRNTHGDRGVILPLVDLWLVDDYRAAGLFKFSRPSGILRKRRCAAYQQQDKKAG